MTTIAVIGRGVLLGKVQRVLIVAPSSVCSVWPMELADYADFPYEARVLSGTAAKRVETLRRPWRKGCAQIAIINYEATWRIEPAIAGWDADMIVCDESQRIKNPTAKQSKAMHRLGAQAKYKLILTGTPLQNSPLDVWSQYRFICPAEFGGSYYRFRANYAVMGGMRVNGKPVQVVGYKNLDDLHRRMYRHAMRVTKEECLDLPPQTFETRRVELSAAERRAYRQMATESIAYIGEKAATADIVLTRLLILQRLTGGFLRLDEDERATQIGKSKLDELERIVCDYVGTPSQSPSVPRSNPQDSTVGSLPKGRPANQQGLPPCATAPPEGEPRGDEGYDGGSLPQSAAQTAPSSEGAKKDDAGRGATEKVVVFCRFVDELKAITEMLARNGIGYAAIWGAVKQEARGEEVRRFQTDEGCRVFVAQIDTAGLGITLTAARIAIFYSPTWNYAAYQQALARTHRIGQRGAECHYIHLICPGTVDEDVMRALDAKKNLADLVVEGKTTLQEG